MIRNPSTRRTILGGIVTGVVTAIGGCLSGSDGGGLGDLGTASVFDDVYVDGLDLVLEVTDNSALEQVNVIDSDDELFAEQSIAAGVERERIELGTSYPPGEYTIVALEDGDEIATQSLEIEPDVRITDLRLGRNHPDEMYEDASPREIRAETILTLENEGTGPDAAVSLLFSGDVPYETPSNLDESGIYDTDDPVSSHVDSIALPPDEEISLYSQRRPFSAAMERISCSSTTEQGEFEVTVEATVQDSSPSESYVASYTAENPDKCEIEIEEV